jgi:type III secretory pathway component EscV
MPNTQIDDTTTLEVGFKAIDTENKVKSEDLLLTLDDAQEVSGVSKFTIRSWCQKNKIKSEKVNGRHGLETRIRKSILINYVKNNYHNDQVIIPEIKAEVPYPNSYTQENSENIQIDPNKVKHNPNQINTDYLNIVKQQLDSIEKQLAVKDSQLNAKDEQITRLMDELKDSRTQSNTILKGINDNMIPLLETNQKMLDSHQNTTIEVQKMTDFREEFKKEIIETVSEIVKPVELETIKEPERKKFLGIF